MAFKTRAELKAYLETGDQPTQAQLAELLDAMVLKSEVGAGGDLDPYPAGDGSAITNLDLPDPLPAISGENLTGINLAEYNDLEDTPSYATSTTFTIDGDKTGQFLVDRRIRVQQDTGYLYTHVKSRSYAAGPDVTTVTITDPMASVNLVAVGLSAFTPAAQGGGITPPMVGWPYYAVTSGSANAYTASIPQIALVPGAVFPLLIHESNNGDSTLDLNETGPKSIKIDGAKPKTGELPKDRIVLMAHNTALDVYEAQRFMAFQGVNHLSAKIGAYTIDPGDLAPFLVVPIDISSSSVPITELELDKMSGIVRYSVVNDAGQSSSNKAEIKADDGTVIAVMFQQGEEYVMAYHNSNRRILSGDRPCPAARAQVAKTADQSVSGGATANALDASASEQIDQGGNFASGAYTTPFAGRCRLVPFLMPEGGIAPGAANPNYSIDGTSQIDWSPASSTSQVNNTPQGPLEFDVSAGAVVRPQVTNVDTDDARNFMGDAAEDESLFIIEMIERHR